MLVCHKCGAENSDNAKYCSQCGTDLVKKTIRCPRCGTENRHDAKYCNECGRPLATARDFASTLGESLANLKTVILAAITILFLAFIIFLIFGKSGVQHALNISTSTSTVATTTTVVLPTLDPMNGTSYTTNVVYDTNTTLTGSIATAGNLTIDSGVVLTTDGRSLIVGGIFNNEGTVLAGSPGNRAAQGSDGQSYPQSYGGSGGSGGGGGGNSVAGSQARAPKLTASLVGVWYSDGMTPFLTGAGGGGGCLRGGYAGNGGDTTALGGVYANKSSGCTGGGGIGGSGSYGVYIQANRMIAGKIGTNGQQGAAGSTDGGGSGGGGAILLAYGPGGYVQGGYSVGGGASQQNGGAGGNGLVLILNYTSAPQAPVRVP